MCIFCERAKASLDDPWSSLDGDGIATSVFNDNEHSSGFNTGKWQGATLQQKLDAERCEELRRRARLPVTVITGFLGAGKTTFVNHLLSARHGRRLAVIENEFGEVAIDDELLGDGGLERGEEAQQVVLMPNGCMCCRVRGDLVAALKRLVAGARGQGNATGAPGDAGATPKAGGPAGAIEQEPEPSGSGRGAELDGIVLECSGLDELAPVLQTFFADLFVQEHVRLDAVVCLCDSPRLSRVLGLAAVPRQGGTGPAEDEGGSSETPGTGDLVPEQHALVLSQLALSDRVLLNKSDLVSDAEGEALVRAVKQRFPGASVTRCVRGEIDIGLVLGVGGFSVDRAMEVDQHFAEMLGAGGSEGSSAPAEGHGHHGPGGGGGGAGAAGGKAHEHDRMGARSVGLELTDAPLDWDRFKAWLKGFLEEEGDRIWRVKGVLWTTRPGSDGSQSQYWGWGAGKRTVVQGLYGHFESEDGEWPAGASRRSRVVFIGDLPGPVRDSLEAGVRSCLARRRPRPPPSPPQRPARQPGAWPGRSDNTFARRLGAVKFGGGDDDMMMP